MICVCLASCSKEEEEKTPVTTPPSLTFSGSSNLELDPDGAVENLIFRCNTSWEIEIPSSLTWLHVDPVKGEAEPGKTTRFTVNISADIADSERKANLKIRYADKSANFTVSQSAMYRSSQFNVPDDMIFSTALGRNSTNVAQGFDYDPEEDIIYISQKSNVFRNHVGWQKRETASSKAIAPDYMLLSCFSHGNNISIERTSDGRKYVWAPNYGTRQDDGSYNLPKIVSRIPLQSGKTVKNTETTDNYYFGMNITWPAFDFKNDMIAVTDCKNFYIYKLSEIMALPVEELTLDFTISYGGSDPMSTGIPAFTGKPVVKAHDCRKAKLLYTVPFTFKSRGLKWQTYCIDNGWIYALLETAKKDPPEIMYDTYVEAYKMDGTENIYKVRQEYMQNRDRICQFGWTEPNYFFCEPEGIKVFGDTMLVMYAMRGEKEPYEIRRPVVFRLAAPTAAL